VVTPMSENQLPTENLNILVGVQSEAMEDEELDLPEDTTTTTGLTINCANLCSTPLSGPLR